MPFLSTRVADVADQPEHALAGDRIEPVGGLVEKDQLRTVDQRLGKLGSLPHAERIAVDVAVARFAQSDIEEDFMGALDRLRPRQS